MSDEGSNNDGGSFIQNSGFVTAVWIIAFLIFIFAPCCFSTRRRKVWLARITTCTWHVDVGPEDESEFTRIARERYEAYMARNAERETRQLSHQEEEEVRHVYLLDRMAKFTVTVTAEDILDKDHIETDEIDESIRSLQESRCRLECMDESSDEEVPSHPGRDFEEGLNMTCSKDDCDVTSACTKEMSDEEALAEIEVDWNTFVSVPMHGEPFSSNGKTRVVPNGCAICLCEFEAGDRVSWSATFGDPHVFHEDCMMKYLLSVGAKVSRRRRLNPDDNQANQDPVEAAVDFPMLCPCCRQSFVCKSKLERPRLLTAATEADEEGFGSQASDLEQGNVDEVVDVEVSGTQNDVNHDSGVIEDAISTIPPLSPVCPV